MKQGYKNKRDFYKAEAERNETAIKMWKESAEQKQKELDEYKKKCEAEKNKRYAKLVYCTNCKEVSSVSIPPGVKLEEGDCVVCRVRNCQLLVTKINVRTF
ncbi:MAG: hypothetical protein AABY22_06925 [Nanoarchaeota archaeon]